MARFRCSVNDRTEMHKWPDLGVQSEAELSEMYNSPYLRYYYSQSIMRSIYNRERVALILK